MGTQAIDDPAAPGRAVRAAGDRPPSPLAEILAATPTAIGLVLLLIASWSDGAFALKSWAPLAVFVLVASAFAPWRPRGGPALAFCGLLGAFAAWSLVSGLWSDRPGASVQGGALALLYAGLAALPVLTLPSRAAAVRIAALVTAGAGILVALTLLVDLRGGAVHFLAGRLNDPVGYRNGTAALFALCFWPLASVAAQRDAHALLRAACFGLAVAALGLSFLTQSRGVVLGFACGAVVALVAGPDRLRRAWLALLAVGAVAIVSSTLLDPYDAFLATARTDPAAVDDALSALAMVSAAGFVVALVVALLDGGLRISARGKRILRATAAAGLVAVALGGVVAGIAAVGDPVSFADRKIQEFKRVEPVATVRTRLGTTGGQRYDLWRIAWRDFRSAPVIGTGDGSYPVRYYRERVTDRNLTTPHSLVLEVLGELGLVGALLLGGALLAAALALARGWRTTAARDRRWASALAAAGAVALGQQAVDWLWLIPAVTGLGVMCLATAVAIVAPVRAPSPTGGRRIGAVAARVSFVLAAALVTLVFVSDSYVRAARAEYTAGRLDKARIAQRLDPFDLTPRYLEASALEEGGHVAGARRALLDALRIEPTSFATMALLGDLETRAGHTAEAKAWYKRALALDPLDVGLQQLAR